MRYFSVPVTVRMRKETLDGINYLIEKWPDKYSSLSQAIRCAIICSINEEHQEEENARKIRESKNKSER